MTEKFKLEMSVAKLRNLSVAVDQLKKSRDMNDLTKVGDALANIYSDMLGMDCVLKLSRRTYEKMP